MGEDGRTAEGEQMRIEARRTIEGEFESVETFRQLFPRFSVISINDKDVIGTCVYCGKILVDGDESYDHTDEIACAQCHGVVVFVQKTEQIAE